MIHPNTELRWIDATIGYGVFATADMPIGTITYVRDSLEIDISPAEFERLPEVLRASADRFSYVDDRGVRVLSWDFARHVNHCCQCNTMSTGYGFEIAIRDIRAGDEITDEYGMFNLDTDMTLVCDRGPCRGRVCASDLTQHAEVWDVLVSGALKHVSSVPQELSQLLDLDTVHALARLAEGEPPRSVRTLLARRTEARA